MPNTIKILFLAANPLDTDRLRLDEEIRKIDRALQNSPSRERFEILQHWAVRVSDVQSLLLRHKPDIVHFSGHGSETSDIFLEDEQGESHAVPARALSRLFQLLKDNIKCVVLNACYSEKQARAIGKHIDCVIGMSRAIGDKSSISFAAAFYQALGFGKNVKTAFELGCNQINLERLSEADIPQFMCRIKSAAQKTFAPEPDIDSSHTAEMRGVGPAKKPTLLSRRQLWPYLAGAILFLFTGGFALFKALNPNPSTDSDRIRIKGVVRDSERQPIRGATININSVHFQEKSDEDGTFQGDLIGKKPGDLIKLSIYHPQYQSKEVQYEIKRNGKIPTITLQKLTDG